jgi:tetratricopeptide (TPR) repeat protein
MRKTLLLALWLLVPVLLLAYHYGPGQAQLSSERAAQLVREARAFEAADDYRAAFDAWTAALAATPADKTQERLQLRLAQTRARMYFGELPEAIFDLDKLLEDARRDSTDPNLEHEIRGTLATAQYYVGWLMRLEGAEPEEWLQPVESARQHFRLLAEQAPSPDTLADYEKNLEATIRLARMDLSELEGLPLPKFCSGCKNVCQKCRGQRQSRAEKPPEEKKDARGAGFNPIPKGGS